MRKNGKYLAALALVLVAALGWAGMRLVSGQEVYHAPQLVLLEGQPEYDLLSGIEYDPAQYALTLVDAGDFDVDTLGSYTLRYELTPLDAHTSPQLEQPQTEQPQAAQTEQPQAAQTEQPQTEDVQTSAQPVSFTRQVVVEEAVSYENVALEQGSQDLLSGITTAAQGYQIEVVSDGGFDANQVEEYAVTYRLCRADNGKQLREFTRYVQVTLPGVSFAASELVVEGDVAQEDWLEGITYDQSQYTLTLLTTPDLTSRQPQRLRYALTQGDTVAAVFGREVTILEGASLEEPGQTPAADNGIGDAPAVLSSGAITLSLPSGATEGCSSAEQAFERIQEEAGSQKPGTYQVQLHGVYTWTEADRTALEGLKGLGAGDTLLITGSTGSHLVMPMRVPVVFPQKCQAEMVMDNLTIDPPTPGTNGYNAPATIAANGSPLTLGEGVTVTGPLRVAGGAYFDEIPSGETRTFVGDTDLTIRCFGYFGAIGGSYARAGYGTLVTQGDNHLTVVGSGIPEGARQGLASISGLNDTDAIWQTPSGYMKSVHTGSSTITITGQTMVNHINAGCTGNFISGMDQTEGTLTVHLANGVEIREAVNFPRHHHNRETYERVVVQVEGEVEVGGGQTGQAGIFAFDQLVLKDGAHVTTASLDNLVWSTDQRRAGQVVFGANSKLTMAGGIVGGLETQGSGAVLEFAGTDSLLEVEGATPMTATGGPLGVKYADGVSVDGGNLIQYTNPDAPAVKLEDYTHLYQDMPTVDLVKDPTGDYLQLVNLRIQLVAPDNTVTTYNTAADALAAVADRKGEGLTGAFELSLLADYDWTPADETALQSLTALGQGDSLTITGDPKDTGKGVYALGLTTGGTGVGLGHVVFPPKSSASYRMERIRIPQGVIAANGSSLTMGEGIETQEEHFQGPYVVGGCFSYGGSTVATFEGDTDLTVLSGNYLVVAAGSWGDGTENTVGDCHLTLGGGAGTVTAWQVYGLNMASDTVAHTGSSTVVLGKGTVAQEVWTGGTVTHQGAQTGGTVTVQINDGVQIEQTLGSYPEKCEGTLTQVDYQIHGAASIGNMYDFDQLVLGENAHLTVSEKLDYVGTNRYTTAKGQVFFGAGSKLTIGSGTVSSLETQGRGAVLEVHSADNPLKVTGATPMDASGGPLGVKYWSGQPSLGNTVLSYTNPAAPEVDEMDYMPQHPDLLLALSSDSTGDHLQFVSAHAQMTAPDNTQIKYETFAKALAGVELMKKLGLTGAFEVALLTDYTWVSDDQTALENLSGLVQGDTLTITGDPENTQAAVYSLHLEEEYGDTDADRMTFPYRSLASYRVERIGISASEYLNFEGWMVANASPLTLGEGIEVTGLVRVVGGGYMQNPDVSTSFVGDTHLTILSGDYLSVSAGSWVTGYLWDEVSTTGDIYLALGGGAGTVTVDGVAGLNYADGAKSVRHTGSSDVILNSKAVVEQGVWAANVGATASMGGIGGIDTQTQTGGTITVQINDGAKNEFLLTAGNPVEEMNTQLEQVVYEIRGTTSIASVLDFDQLILGDGAHLTVTGQIHSSKQYTAAEGQVVFGDNAVLTLPSGDAQPPTGLPEDWYGASMVGSLKTQGSGAVLEITRGNPLEVQGATDSTGGKLTLRFNPSNTQARNGDQLLHFRTQPNLADVSHYLSGFPGQPQLVHDQTTGYIQVKATSVTLQTNDGTAVYYPSVAAAMEQIETENNGENTYVVTVRQQHYEMTAEDLEAMDQFSGQAKSVTFTSTFTLTDGDPLESGESVGQTVTRHVVINGDLSFRCATTLKGIYLEYQGHDEEKGTTDSHNIYANGYPLTLGVGVDTGSGNYPTLYGGSKTEAVTGITSLTVQSGAYQNIYGGGQEQTATANGASIVYGEFAALHGSIYGGGQEGDVTGNTSITIAGGTTGGQADSKVVAGGQSGDVDGTAQLIVSGGSAGKTMVLAGADNGVVGNVSISILEPSSGAEPSAPKAHVYGGAYGSGSVTGGVNVTITNGTYYGTISGGDLNGDMPGGNSVLSFSGSDLKVENLLDFTTLNLGYEKNKCNLTVTGQLDSNHAASGNFDRTGRVIFNNGSALNLTGKSAHRVGSIQTTTQGGASHLHLAKAEGVSYPLYISQGNASLEGYTINVGIPDSELAPATSRPAAGDDLLFFAEQSQVDLAQYLCGLALLEPVQNGENPAIVELGISTQLHAKLTGVTHTSQADTNTTGSSKILSFLFVNVDDAGKAGQAPTSAYIDHNAAADDGWVFGGQVPAGALGGELTNFLAVEGETGQWTGQITVDVDALDSDNPQFYYLHVRAPGSQRTIILDVYAPQVNKDVTSSSNGAGGYTFTIQVQDKVPVGLSPDPTNEGAPVFENAGIYQVGWSLTKHDPQALTKPMTVQGVQTISDDVVWLPYDWTFEVTAEELAQASTVGGSKVFYLYLKDTLGNTRMITVPMSDHQIDVSVPTRVGVVAMKGVDTPQVKAPQCALINYGANAVNASVTQVRFDQEANQLTLVTKPGSPNSAFGEREMDLRIKPLAGEQGYAYSLANLTSPQAQPLYIGRMEAYTDQGTANQIGFTFDALYNPQIIVETSEWSMFYLSYRFEAVGNAAAP